MQDLLPVKQILAEPGLFRNQIAHDGTRIRDLFLTKEVLYQLSYMGIKRRTRAQYVEFRGSSKYDRLPRFAAPTFFTVPTPFSDIKTYQRS